MEKKHAKLGASTSEIWINCPGAPALWEEAPEKEESAYAIQGTIAHDLAENWIRHKIENPLSGFRIDKKYNGHLGPDDIEAVRVFVYDVLKDKKEMPGADLVLEERVDLSDLIAPEMYGTVDAGLADEFGRLVVNDYKHGKGVGVELYKTTADGQRYLNTQLVYYALGLAKKYGFNFDTVVLKITQPRYSQHLPVQSVEVHISELRQYIWIFKKAVERTMKKGAKRTAGKWCRFCKAKPICKEGNGGYRTDVRSDF